MRHAKLLGLVLLAAGLLTITGCSNNKGKIEGTKWASQAANIKGVQVPAGALTLEFTSDKKLIYIAGPMKMTGTYSLGFGDNVTFNFDEALDGLKKHVEKIKVSGDQLTMTDSDGTSLTFQKSK